MTPTFYANINNAYTSEGDGTEDYPLNWTQFLAKLLQVDRSLFRLKGLRVITSNLNIASFDHNVVENWLSEPWRLKGQGSNVEGHNIVIEIGGDVFAPTLKNGIIELDILTGLESAIRFGRGATHKSFYNLYLISRHHARYGFGVIENNSGGCSMYGCVLVATSTFRSYQNTLLLNNSFNSPFYYESCVFTTNYENSEAGAWGDIFIDDGHSHFKNCVFDRPRDKIIGALSIPNYTKGGTNRSIYLNFEDCQFGWVNDPTSWPGANGSKAQFSYTTLGHDINVLGDGIFKGYDRDMFGDPRSRVGCFSNYPTPSIPLPSVVVPPTSQTHPFGSSVRFVVECDGRYLSFQWRKNGVGISGETSSILTLSNINDNSSGVYDLLITNPIGTVTSPGATLTVIPLPPTVTTHPASIEPIIGSTAVFTVVVEGTSAVFQWRKNGIDIPGATESSFSILNVTEVDRGLYDVRVFNTGGEVISFGAHLDLVGNPDSLSGDSFFSEIQNQMVEVVSIIKSVEEVGSESYLVYLQDGNLNLSKILFDQTKLLYEFGKKSTTP